jgi:hypothetical protein
MCIPYITAIPKNKQETGFPHGTYDAKTESKPASQFQPSCRFGSPDATFHSWQRLRPQPTGSRIYCILRRNMGKTVTPPQHFAAASGFKAGEPLGTPEKRRALDELLKEAWKLLF